MSQIPLYVSGYNSQGIYLYTFDTESGTLCSQGLAAESQAPSWLSYHQGHLYAINEVDSFEGREGTGYVTAYRIGEQGQLEVTGQQASEGSEPCHATVDRTGSYLLVSNYSGGSVAVLPLKPSLGQAVSVVHHDTLFKHTLGIPDRQEKAHCHSINVDPLAGHYAFVNDLGCDLLAIHRFDQGLLHPHSHFTFPKGTGPRHLAFAPNHNHFVYVLGELSNELFMLEFDFDQGKLNEIQRIPALPEGAQGDSLGAEIEFSPNGKFLWVSIRGQDILTVYEVNERTGKLSLLAHLPTAGQHPRYFTLDPTGNFLLVANKDSNTIVVFRFNAQQGSLDPVSRIHHTEPTCLRFPQ
ncbi:Lactonase, 7-bladed beta-propeller-domain-containing protein [Sporodiniella umbellata]|nr:Lactonase, 7-bladed beta-propeller-domain-containing protein [Sporodiniella umbellata]